MRNQILQNQNPRRKLYHYVVEAIGTRIIDGLYKPGETLPNEDALCREFNVSRGVLREAVKVLTDKGLILTRPKTGTRILSKTNWNLFDGEVLVWKLRAEDKLGFLKNVTEVRRTIECEAAKLAAQRATPTEINRIESRLEALEACLETEATYDYERYLAADMHFHAAILEASHNELLAQIGRTMRVAVQAGRQVDSHDLRVHQESLPFHQQMVQAIAAGNAEQAHQAAWDLFEQVWRHIPAAGK